jgi:hypothetical protein
LAYCESFGKNLPKVYEYRTATSNTLREGISIEYEKPYKAPKFDFMAAEWTTSIPLTISTTLDSVILYSDGEIHNDSTKPTDKKKTSGSLGFRCIKRPG